MAVTKAEPNIEAQIYVNDAPLQEYDNDEGEDDDAPNKVTTYVEAVTGANFEVRYKFSGPGFKAKHDITTRLFVDGEYASGTVYYADEFGSCGLTGKLHRLKRQDRKHNHEKAQTKDLQSLLIIPRSPTPPPLEERDINTLNQEETRELLRRQKERAQADNEVKVEVGVKSEHSRAQGRTLSVGGSDDDDEVSFVSASKRRKYAVTMDEEETRTIDLT